MEVEHDIPNLNPRRALISNFDNFEKILKNANIDILLDMYPRTYLPLQTILYHFDNDIEKGFEKLGKNQGLFPDYKDNLIEFDFNYYNVNTKYIHVLYNSEEIKVLDCTFIAAELGFNPISFSNKEMMNYCKQNKLDGFINLKESVNTSSTCYSNMCPVLYLLNRKYSDDKEILSKVKMLGMIDTITPKQKKLNLKDINKLLNLLFCRVYQIIEKREGEFNFDIYGNLYGNMIVSTKNLNLVYYQDYYKLLNLDHTNLKNPCVIDYIKEEIQPEQTDLSILTTNKNIHKTDQDFFDSDENDMEFYLSDKIYDYAFTKLAKKLNVNPYIYSHYHLFSQFPQYKTYTIDLLNNYTIQTIISHLELQIFNDLYTHYKFFRKGDVAINKVNINSVNIQYIFSTKSFLIKKIFTIFSRKKWDEVISILMLKHIDKGINNLFNADHFYHTIVNEKYTKARFLYDDLVKDIIQYQRQQNINLPTIDYNFLKQLLKISKNLPLQEYLSKMLLTIYDKYKEFITNKDKNLMFVDMYAFLAVDDIAAFFMDVAKHLNQSPSLINHYVDITNMDPFKNYKTIKIEGEPTAGLINWFNDLKISILTFIFTNQLATYYKLDKGKFLTMIVEQLIKQQQFQDSLDDVNIDWYDFLINPNFDINSVINIINQIYNNNIMLPYIYEELKIHLSPSRTIEVLDKVRNDNLFEIYIDYLNGDITLDKLKQIIYVEEEHTEEDEGKKNKKKKKKKSKSKSSSTYSLEESI